ncbi:MAG: hypothetical protein DRP27_09530 [Thermotogae bacterium]|nr:MAG: hypothetical protein DRP27_09530 [Thermotogota bacterium]
MDKQVAEQIIRSFVGATMNVYRSLTNTDLAPSGIEKAASSLFKTSGVVILLSFSGAFAGRTILATSEEMMEFIYECIMDGKPTQDDLLVTANEFGNMVVGHAVTDINNRFRGSNVRPTPPSSYIGENLTFFNFKMSAYNVVFKSQQGILKLNVALEEERK